MIYIHFEDNFVLNTPPGLLANVRQTWLEGTQRRRYQEKSIVSLTTHNKG